MHGIQQKIVLGSGSPRRQQLLREIDISFRVIISTADEITLPHLEKGDIAIYLAEQKSDLLKNQIEENETLVTADTIVWLDRLLGKPVNEQEAMQMLRHLSGKRHFVYTGLHFYNKEFRNSICVESAVTFRKLTEDQIRKYVEDFHPLDKAGAYGAQESLPEDYNPCSKEEIAFMKKYQKENLFEKTLQRFSPYPLIEKIEGSYFNVMGLPVVELVNELK